MKTEQRGVTTSIIAVVVIVVVAVAVVAVVLLLKGGGPGGLPIYPGSQSWEIPSDIRGYLPAGVDFAGYTVSGTSVQGILNWYKGQMTDWTLVNEASDSLLYRKGDDGAFIGAISGETVGQLGTVYVLATGPWSTISELGGGGGGTPPSVALTVSAKANPNNTVTLTISHEGGDDLSLADLKVQASDSTGTMQTAALSPSSGTLSMGSTCTATYTYGANPSGAVITVYITHVPSAQKIFSSHSIAVGTS